jgi:hypothetical protein
MRARAGSFAAHLVWVGLVFWLAYAYGHLAFGAPYHAGFVLYVAALGLSAFGLLDGLLRIDVRAVAPAFARAPRRSAAWLLTVGGVGMTGLWLSEIIVALPDGQPASNQVYDMPSPTYVLDLAWLIPLALGSAWMLWRHHPAGPVVTAPTLVMLLVLSVAMLTVTPFGVAAGLHRQADYASLFVIFSVVFGALGAAEAAVLALGARRMQPPAVRWLRPSLWPGVATDPAAVPTGRAGGGHRPVTPAADRS